ncbi:MAG: glycosyltransferase family 2 protein [Blastocatellia bacterium]
MQRPANASELKKVALVIPVYNRRETTLSGLRSLSRIDRYGLNVKIFVVDDASPDGTADAVAEEFPEVEIIKGNGNLHYAAGTNRGIERALEWKPDYVVTMNDDALFHVHFLQKLITTAEANPRSVVGSLLLLWDEPYRVFQVGQYWDTMSGGWVVPDDMTAFSVPGSAFEVECIVGNCVLFPADAIRECGLMDEQRFPHGWGDAQYLMRMRKAGLKLLIEPRSFVWCEPNTYPEPLHLQGVRDVLKTLFINDRHPLNLKRQFVARWESAPSKSKAVAAFIFFVFILFSKSAGFVFESKRPRQN